MTFEFPGYPSPPLYQLALTTPGISPLNASSRKHILHSWNLRIKPRGLPHILQRLYLRTLNLGVRPHFTISDVFAISSFSYCFFVKGIPKSLKSSNASLPFFAVVAIVMSIPWILVTLSTSISGNISCSLNPNE